jgi:hypothetical protein
VKHIDTTQNTSRMQSLTRTFAICALATLIAPRYAAAQSPFDSANKFNSIAGAGAITAVQDDDAPKPKVPTSKLDPATYLVAEVGYSAWNVSGSENKFRQYATVPGGFFLKELTYVPKMEDPGQYLYTSLKGIGGEDYRGDLNLVYSYGGTRITGYFSNSSFFEDTPAPVGASDHHSAGFNIRQSVTKNFSLDYRYKSDTQVNRYESPNPGENQFTQFQDLTAAGKLGNGYLKLSTSNLHFEDKTGTLTSSDLQTISGSYLWNVRDNVDMQAEYSRANIGQAGMQGSHIESFAFNGGASIGSGTDVNVAVQTRHLSIPNTLNDYVRHQGIESFSLSQRYKSWRGSISLRLQDDERVSSTQTYVDVPKWSTVEGRISGKVPGGMRLTVRGYAQSLIEQPSFNTNDSANLYWTAREFAETRLEGSHDDITYYLVYTYQDDKNASRASYVTTSHWTAGATYQVSPKLNMFAEFHRELWSGQAAITGYPSIGNYLPDVTTGILQLTYAPTKRSYLSLTYTGFGTRNDNPLMLPDGNTRGTFVTINGRYKFNKGLELGFMVAPWTYRDNVVNAMNYNATVFMLTGSKKF